MNTKMNEPDKALLLAKCIEDLNDSTFVIAEETKRKVLAQTGNKAMAEAAWQRTVARGWNLTSSIVRTLNGIGE